MYIMYVICIVNVCRFCVCAHVHVCVCACGHLLHPWCSNVHCTKESQWYVHCTYKLMTHVHCTVIYMYIHVHVYLHVSTCTCIHTCMYISASLKLHEISNIYIQGTVACLYGVQVYTCTCTYCNCNLGYMRYMYCMHVCWLCVVGGQIPPGSWGVV